MSPLLRLWLHGRWARSTQADAIARVDVCLAMLGFAAIVLLL